MKNTTKRIVPLSALAVLLISIAPIAYGSTLTVTLNPTTGLAKVNSVSATKVVFTYPAGSSISNYLKNVSASQTFTGSFAGSTSGAKELQGGFDDEDSHIAVQNMSVALGYSAHGNATAFVLDKTTNITAWVTGVFTVVNGTVTANLGWRAFVIRGAMYLPFEGSTMDINLVGPSMHNVLEPHMTAANIFFGAFGGASLWNRPTLNFSALNTPLSTWTKNYNSATNTTTFSKTISGESNYTASADINGQKYSLSAFSDPSGVVTVHGYANASGDSLVMAAPPASTLTSAGYLAVAAAVVVLVIAVSYLALRAKARTTTQQSTALPV
jgi:hypothetical protein